MRRVAITGMGIVSCLGSDQQTVVAALRDGRSGITFNPTFAEMGLRSQVCGSVAIDLDELVERKARRFMGDAAAFACVAMQQAIDDAGLEAGEVSNERTGLIAGSGGASSANIVRGADALRDRSGQPLLDLGPPRLRHRHHNDGRDRDPPEHGRSEHGAGRERRQHDDSGDRRGQHPGDRVRWRRHLRAFCRGLPRGPRRCRPGRVDFSFQRTKRC